MEELIEIKEFLMIFIVLTFKIKFLSNLGMFFILFFKTRFCRFEKLNVF